MQRSLTSWRVICGAVLMLAALLGAHRTARAATPAVSFNGVDVVQIEGLIDPPNASLIRDAIHDAEHRHSTLLVFQMDSNGVVATNPWSLAQAIQRARVPVAVWVGPAGAVARGGAALIAEAAPVLSLASNAHIGALRPLRADRDDPSVAQDRDAKPLPVSTHRITPTMKIVKRSIGAADAKRLRVVDRVDPVIGDLIVGLDGTTVVTAAGAKQLTTAEVVDINGRPRRKPNQDVRFRKLSLTGQLQHTLGAPWVAYFLFVAGGALIVFEFFTISIGLAGLVGAAMLAGACFGFSHLPVHLWALALLALALVGYAIDIQAGGLGPWTIIATASLVAGSIALYGGSGDLAPPWWTIVLVCLGTVLFMIGGMTAMLRSRFSTPTVGREGMIGELGIAEVDVDPNGVVRVRDALWQARTNRATPVKVGEIVRVVSVEGLLLEIEPESGGAKDYRDRSGSRS